ncbi:MAG: hypothetical protein ACQGVK_13325 [Myxococcota bacterium]
MTSTTRPLLAVLTLLLVQGLAAPPGWCAWMCDPAAAPVAMEASCHGDGAPMAPPTAPNDESEPGDGEICPSCEAALASLPPVTESGRELSHTGLLLPPGLGFDSPPPPSLRPLARAPDPSPPEPIWLLTTSLLL